MPKYNIMIGRFPYGNDEDSRCVDWLLKTACLLSTDRRFNLQFGKIADTPIDMTRNAMVEYAMAQETDILLIVDNDIDPDCELAEDPDAKPFLQTTLDFMLEHPGPCVVAAPYCGPPPIENVYVFQWGDHQSDDHDGYGSLNQYTREQAAVMTGIREVAALPTGLMAIDMRAFRQLKPPYFYYEWKNEGPPCPHCGVCKPGPRSEKGSTEDVTLTRDMSLAGIKQYCNWDAWAAHIKKKRVRKPRPWTADMVADRMKDAVVRGVHSHEKLRDIKPTGRFGAEIAEAIAAGAVGVGREPAELPLPPPEPKKKTFADIAAEADASRRLMEETAGIIVKQEWFAGHLSATSASPGPVQGITINPPLSPIELMKEQAAARMADPGEDIQLAAPEPASRPQPPQAEVERAAGQTPTFLELLGAF